MRSHGWKLAFLLLLGAFVFLWLVKAPIISSYLTHHLNIPISIGRASIWPKETILRRFKIQNPHGFKLSQAFKADRTVVDYQLSELFSTPNMIETISMDQVYLGIEFMSDAGTDNNWTVIVSQIKPPSTRREFIIQKMILTNITVEVQGAQAAALGIPQTQTFDRMEFDNIDSREGFPTKELIAKVFHAAGIEQFLEQIFNPANILEDVTAPLKIL